jgi:type 1 fimbria pilin
MSPSILAMIGLLGVAGPLWAQTTSDSSQQTTLRISSRAVLVDVLVTDRKGKPVSVLKKDALTLTEQGEPQTISFFEEYRNIGQPAPAELPSDQAASMNGGLDGSHAKI